MNKPTTTHFVGLDVHADSIAVADAAWPRDVARVLATVPHETKALLRVLEKLGPKQDVCCCYEAGPTGYGLARTLNEAGWNCTVIAPSLVPKKPGQRIKTDRRDAVTLAQSLRAGDLVAVAIPDPASEALRDLSRARGAAKRAEQVARHQLSKFLLRHARRYTQKTHWNRAHLAWIAAQRFDQPAQQSVLTDALSAVELAGARVAQLTEQLRSCAADWSQMPLVRALQALRGVEFVTAVGLVAEVHDFRRFATARQLMAYLGLIPSEQTSGTHRRRGPITKTGNPHARRLLVETAWHYRRPPRLSKALRQRGAGLSDGVRAIAWKAQCRLYRRMTRLVQRGKALTEAIVATARELAGFIWAISREEALLAG